MAKLSLLELLSFRYKLDELPPLNQPQNVKKPKKNKQTKGLETPTHAPSVGTSRKRLKTLLAPISPSLVPATQPTPGPKTQEQDLITLPVTESNTGPVYEDTWPPLGPKRSESPRGETSITDSKALTSLEATDLPPGVQPPLDILKDMTNLLTSRGLSLQTPTSDEMIHPAFRGTSNTGSGLTASQLQLLKDLEDLEEPQLQTATSGFVCPFCYEQLPDHHSDELKALYEYFKKESRGFTVKLPWPRTAGYCSMHTKEFELIPMGRARGWPIEMDWVTLPSRVKPLSPHLWSVAKQRTPSVFLAPALQRWKTLGPSKANSSYHNLDDFRVEIPGYYGMQGNSVIYLTLERMFLKKKSLAKITALALPMSPDYLIRKVLVPEAALGLIAQDLLKEIGDPLVLQTLQESRDYGAAVFSGDQDNSITPN
ncbi:hypothetical protein MJO28_008415 [Puccinia striiformis f. sp. tritici]|uniref:Uncharacterized protein n=1 Tax=Puccinia striiformis f. sp. tritici TaxID=168172 RepID=A0ACC0EB42_9BASI|nr:hypothetical protein Pst134EB_016616 [Puccinia striiformis f. sp. tritici]KAI7949594.1 hypothetical protein MJO28_008415 [Puccinia striiformis f. sp. tritici]